VTRGERERVGLDPGHGGNSGTGTSPPPQASTGTSGPRRVEETRAYDTAGTLRWSRFAGADTIVRGAAGRLAYVETKERRTAPHPVLELDSGRTVRTLRRRELRVPDR
jgi:hypothetical protein